MSVIKMYLAISGVGGDSDSIDIQADGFLESMGLGLVFASDGTPATGDLVQAEISFLSTSTMGGGHDSRGSLLTAASIILTTLANSVCNPAVPMAFQSGISVPVMAGERIFIHGVANQADITGIASGYLFVKDKLNSRPGVRRR